ncbi:hypothetical protein Nepgr_003747 [Nepenthes gracilis]|uniref:UspA domain-containing protein n=1 Tax=Nepenthes gracilis TaxID=150966 RepID=A0AAD3S072_NEPGR|nr:hypothetical protein Nepgr_003747 [Nepenthes gracilis]
MGCYDLNLPPKVPVLVDFCCLKVAEVPFSEIGYIESPDFQMKYAKDYYGLAPGKSIWLRYAFPIKCTDVIFGDDNETILEIQAEYDPVNKPKLKGVLHWVVEPSPGVDALKMEVRLFDKLFFSEVSIGVETLRRKLIVLRNSKEPRLPVQKNRDLRGSKEMDEINSNKKVMVAIDDSESSHGALEWALQNLHQKITSSGLLLFHAISIDYGGIYAGTYGGAPAELLTSIQENRKKLANALLGKAKDICANHGIVAETVSIIGEPKESICDAVEKMHIELLVVGSHGRKGLPRAFLGSVSNYCVHHAKCPVLVVRKAA